MASLALRLTPAITATLQEIVRSRLHGVAVIQRARCILLASEKRKFIEISSIVALSARAVGRWVKRFAESIGAIRHTEETQPKAAAVISIACEDPEASGRPVTSWTANEIAEEAVKRNIVTSVSKSQVQRFLSDVQLRPHKNKGWCFTTEKNQELFDEQVKLVCQTYLDAPGLFARKNIRTVSVDEMTSLQANEKRAPTKRPAPGHSGKEECQYTRHGTVPLTGNWDVVAGQFLLPTIEETRNNEDFAKHIERLIKTGLADGWVFVVDNLNTHCGEPLVRMVAKYLDVSESELGEVKKRGILKNMASRRAFLSDPTHKIRFVYTPKHSSWLNQIEAVFGMIKRRVMRGGNFTSKADLMEKLTRFATYFNETIAKPMKWTFTGRPTEKESVEQPKTWRELWPLRRLPKTVPKTDGT